MKLQLKIEGNRSLVKVVENASKQAMQYVEEEIHATGEDILNKAVSRAPVQYGILKNSGYNLKGNMGTEVGFKARYAPYVEFGTGDKVKIPAGLEDYAMTFYVTGKGRLPAHPFFFNSVFEEIVKLNNRFNKDFSSSSLTVRLL